jgi:DNA-binding GntR family transcriptional regulator
MTGLHHATLAEQAYQELRARIISGRLAAGQRLLADELAGQLAISQTPVKEALAELARDGLVEAASRRASTVRRFDAEDIVEIYEARCMIETHAIDAAMRAQRVDAALLEKLRAILAARMVHLERQTPVGLQEAVVRDREFHETIVAIGGNSVLAGWHRVLLRQTQTFHAYSPPRYDMGRNHDEHTAILAALRSGDSAAAVEAIRRHLTACRDETLSHPPGDPPPR